MKKIGTILVIIIAIITLGIIGYLGYGYYKKATIEVKNPVAIMEVENFGTIKIELYPKQAPNTVANFITLANRGKYNDLTFHRIVKDFMIQGGDKNGDGKGSATKNDLQDGEEDKKYSIKGEFIANNVKNTLKFEEGTLGMARSDYTSYSPELTKESYDSGSAQFFVVTKPNTSLNGYYTAFGKVIEGIDIVHKIENVEVKEPEKKEGEEGAKSTEKSIPVNPVKIKSISVETYGIDYKTPKTQEPFDYMTWLYSNYQTQGQ